MRVTELFEAVQGEPGQGGRLRGGAYYSPTYDAEAKILRGSVLDWMDAAGITKDDIATAVEQIKKDPLIQQMADAGMKYVHKPDSEKRGTLTFEVSREYPNGRKYKTHYQIYANGQIRSSGTSTFAAHQGRLVSPKPRFKAGDAVGSLKMIYTQALEEVLRKWKKSSKQA